MGLCHRGMNEPAKSLENRNLFDAVDRINSTLSTASGEQPKGSENA